MGEPEARAPGTGAALADPDRELDELRALLVRPEREAIDDLRRRLDAREVLRETAAVLPEAVAARARDPRLVRALTPAVEHALLDSARRDPRPLADALFPVLGPAIRTAIANALSTMVESMGRVLEQGLSWRALGWRVTAWRTGRSYAEVVLLHTLVYSVEQVFLIHRETGLLLQHVALDRLAGQSADIVSGMLTAIRDFVSDSFGAGADDAVDVLRVGDRSIFVEQGPRALLAAVVRGTPPPEIREVFRDALDTIHLHFAPALEAFDGDAAPFVAARPILEQTLRSEQRQDGGARRSRRRLAIVVALVAVALAAWAFLAWQQSRRVSAFLDALRAEPGLVLVSAERRGGALHVSGLRDPLARDPGTFVEPAGLRPADVEGRWTPYQSLEPPIVLARARHLLRPPAGVLLELRDDVLVASGQGAVPWVAEAARVAPFVAGVRRLDAAALVDAEITRLSALVESTTLHFARGTTALLPGQEDRVRDLAAAVGALREAARVAGRRLTLTITGHADSDGSPAANEPLSRARAESVAALTGAASPELGVTIAAAGSREPLVAGTGEREKERNRRVSFRVTGEGAGPGGDNGARP